LGNERKVYKEQMYLKEAHNEFVHHFSKSHLSYVKNKMFHKDSDRKKEKKKETFQKD